jgi:hypothetical protein
MPAWSSATVIVWNRSGILIGAGLAGVPDGMPVAEVLAQSVLLATPGVLAGFLPWPILGTNQLISNASSRRCSPDTARCVEGSTACADGLVSVTGTTEMLARRPNLTLATLVVGVHREARPSPYSLNQPESTPLTPTPARARLESNDGYPRPAGARFGSFHLDR